MLVNNAGFGSFGAFHTLDLDTESSRDPAQRGRARAAHARGRGARWCARGRGGILNVSSLAGFQPGPMNATYGATKAFVTSFTEAVHEELKGTGVSVTVLCPGFTRTGFQDAANVPGERGSRVHVAGGRRGRDAPASTRSAKNRAVAIPGALNKVLGHVLERHAARDHPPHRRRGRRSARG